MKSTIFVAAVHVALTVPAVFAQDFPECANSCLVSGLAKFGCSSTNIKCVCSSEPFRTYALDCMRTSCPAESLPAIIVAAYKLCASSGVTIQTTPPGETMAPTTSAPAETTTAPPETTPTPEVPYPTTTSEVPYPTTTSEVPYPTTTIAGTGTLTPTGNSTTPTIAPPPTNSEGAAIKNIASFGAMAMAIAGLFAL